MSSPTVTQHNINGGSSQTTPFTFTCPTFSGTDAIFCVIGVENGGGHPTITSVTGAGVTFTKRGVLQESVSQGGAFVSLVVFAAPLGAGGGAGSLTAETITVNMSGTVDAIIVSCFGVTHLNANSPISFDTNGILPVEGNPAGTTPTPLTYSTTQSDDLLLAFVYVGFSDVNLLPTGFTQIDTMNRWPAFYSTLTTSYKSVAAPQSSVSLSGITGSGAGTQFAIILDAVAGPFSLPPRSIAAMIG